METDWQQIIMLSLLGWGIFAFLAAAAFGWIMSRYSYRDQEEDDREQMEYLAKHSQLKMLQKQAGGRWNVIPMRRK